MIESTAMVKETAPVPSGGFVPNQTRRTKRVTATKERKRKASRRPTDRQWLFGALPGMVDSLCRKMYENEFSSSYSGRDEFCKEYADLVVDQRRVKGPVERVSLLERVLSIAENNGRVDIISGSSRSVGIYLSDEEHKRQRQQAKERDLQGREKWQVRRRRKAA